MKVRNSLLEKRQQNMYRWLKPARLNPHSHSQREAKLTDDKDLLHRAL